MNMKCPGESRAALTSLADCSLADCPVVSRALLPAGCCRGVACPASSASSCRTYAAWHKGQGRVAGRMLESSSEECWPSGSRVRRWWEQQAAAHRRGQGRRQHRLDVAQELTATGGMPMSQFASGEGAERESAQRPLPHLVARGSECSSVATALLGLSGESGFVPLAAQGVGWSKRPISQLLAKRTAGNEWKLRPQLLGRRTGGEQRSLESGGAGCASALAPAELCICHDRLFAEIPSIPREPTKHRN